MNAPNLEDFVTAAREFCALAEGDGNMDKTDLWRIRKLLLLLIYHIPAIEAVPKTTEGDAVDVDDERFSAVVQRFKSLPFDVYKLITCPYDISPENTPDITWLWMDLPEIYSDLAQGLSLVDQGYIETAYLEWSYSYQLHWGRHAMHALTAIELYRLHEVERIRLEEL